MDSSSSPLALRFGSLGKVGDLAIVLAATMVVPRVLMAVVEQAAPTLARFDPDDAFLRLSIHHVLLTILTLIFMKLFANGPLARWGLNIQEWRASLKIIVTFTLIWLAITVASSLAVVMTGTLEAVDYTSPHPLTVKNMVGHLAFQLFLSGSGEEPLFRGFVMSLLAVSWSGQLQIRKTIIPISGLWATLMFMLGHIDIDITTLTITHFAVGQQVGAFILGLLYATWFHRTGSLLAPILVHGFMNAISVISLYVMKFLATS